MHIFLRAVLIVTGLFLIGFAFLCYEDEEKRIQSRLEELWLHLSYVEHPVYDWHSRVAKQIITIVNSFLTRIFGPELISWRFAAVSVAIAAAGSLFTPIPLLSIVYAPHLIPAFCGAVAIALLFVAIAMRGGWLSTAVVLSALPWATLCSAFLTGKSDSGRGVDAGIFDWASQFAGVMVPAAIVSLVGDVAAIWLLRKVMLREFNTWIGIWIALAGTCVAVLVALVLPTVIIVAVSFWMFQGDQYGVFGAMFLWQIIAMDGVDLLLMFGVFFIAISLALHHAMWPTLLRGSYSIQRLGFSKVRAASWSVGIALLGGGIVPTLDLRAIWDVVRKQIGG